MEIVVISRRFWPYSQGFGLGKRLLSTELGKLYGASDFATLRQRFRDDEIA
jgi:hypothetical protein